MKKETAYFWTTFFCAFTIDRLTKYFASKIQQSIPIVKNFIYLTFVKNSGLIFGIAQGINSIIIWAYLIIIGLLLFFYEEFPKDSFSKVMVALVFAGVLGNFIDRLFFGYVIDFIDLKFWPVFNIADLCLNIGVFGIVFRSCANEKKKAK